MIILVLSLWKRLVKILEYDSLLIRKIKIIERIKLLFVKMEKVTDYKNGISYTIYYKKMNGNIYVIKEIYGR